MITLRLESTNDALSDYDIMVPDWVAQLYLEGKCTIAVSDVTYVVQDVDPTIQHMPGGGIIMCVLVKGL
jgi:hypothetical protein